jgi:hypothetical protein
MIIREIRYNLMAIGIDKAANLSIKFAPSFALFVRKHFLTPKKANIIVNIAEKQVTKVIPIGGLGPKDGVIT